MSSGSGIDPVQNIKRTHLTSQSRPDLAKPVFHSVNRAFRPHGATAHQEEHGQSDAQNLAGSVTSGSPGATRTRHPFGSERNGPAKQGSYDE